MFLSLSSPFYMTSLFLNYEVFSFSSERKLARCTYPSLALIQTVGRQQNGCCRTVLAELNLDLPKLLLHFSICCLQTWKLSLGVKGTCDHSLLLWAWKLRMVLGFYLGNLHPISLHGWMWLLYKILIQPANLKPVLATDHWEGPLCTVLSVQSRLSRF